MAKKAKLTYSEYWYSPVFLRHILNTGEAAKVRKEYTRLRDISQKRLKRLAAAGLADTEVYKKNVNHYPKLSEIKSANELSARLSDLSRFIKSDRSTVSGFKSVMEKSLNTLHEHGYTFVTKENYKDFVEFMAEYRYQHLDQIYDSGEAADTFEVIEKHEIKIDQIRKDFEYWIENRKTLESMRSLKRDWGDPEAIKKRAERKNLRIREVSLNELYNSGSV